MLGDNNLKKNENNIRLLEMTDSLLKSNAGNFSLNLEKFVSLAKDIDKFKYENLFNKINDQSNAHNQSLEDELKILEEIEKEYEQFNEFQYRLKDKYEGYSLDGSNLELSNIEDIDIQAIVDRKNLINGYLVNVKKINDFKEKLKIYNEQLIVEDKKRISNEKIFVNLEDELKKLFVDSEGRVYSKENNRFERTTVLSEYRANGFDLEKLFLDNGLLNNELSSAINHKNEEETELRTAEICYYNMPNKESQNVLNIYKLESVKANYKVSLLEIAKLVSNYEIDYESIVNKRNTLIEKIKYRKKMLEQLGVKFFINSLVSNNDDIVDFDSFTMFSKKINKQLESINKLGSNLGTIKDIRKEINYIDDELKELEIKNTEFMIGLNREVKYIKDNFSMSSVDISKVHDDIELDPFYNLTSEVKKVILPNQVINICDYVDGFRYSKVIEQTTGVIKRVNEMLGNADGFVPLDIDDEYVPELVIENSSDALVQNNEVTDDNGLFENNYLFDDIEIIKDAETVQDTEEVQSNISSIDSQIDTNFSINNVPDNLEIDNTIDSLFVSNNDDLFKDEVPFESTKLFSDKFEDLDEKVSFDKLKIDNDVSLKLDDEFKKNEIESNLDLSYDKVEEKNVEIEPILDNSNDFLKIESNLEDASLSDDNIDDFPDAFWVTQENNPDDSLKEENVISLDEQWTKLLSNDDGKIKKRAA